MSPDGFSALCRERKTLTKDLLTAAFHGFLPSGYLLAGSNQGSELIFFRLEPKVVKEGARVIYFHHTILHKLVSCDGLDLIVPTCEYVAATVDEYRAGEWQNIHLGPARKIEVRVFNNELGAAVRELVSKLMMDRPFFETTWQPCPHDPKGKFELIHRGRKLQSIWKSGRVWGTLLGNSCKTKAAAILEAESAARMEISTYHQERLSSL